MKIKLGYFFDSGSYPGPLADNEATQGIIHVGPLGLLSILETRLGIVTEHSGQPLRIARYLAAMKKLCAEGSPFYKKSFEADSWSSAKTLLDTRDSLYLSGWNGSELNESAKLEDLSQLEKEAELPAGIAERITLVKSRINEFGINGISEICICGAEIDKWPSCWGKLVNLLGKNQIKISFQPVDCPVSDRDLGLLQKQLSIPDLQGTPSIKADGSLIVINGATALETAEALAAWLAADENDSTTAIISESGTEILDTTFKKYGLPGPGNTTRSRWRAAMQLLPLAIGIHWAPFEPQRFLEFLTAPFTALHPVMSRKLARALEEEPGIGGRKMQEAIKECREWANDHEESKKLLASLDFWTSIERTSPSQGLSVDDINKICTQVGKSISALSTMSGQNVGLLGAVAATVKEFTDTIKAMDVDKLSKTQIDRVLDTVIGAGLESQSGAQASPWGIASHPGKIDGPLDRLIWWNFSLDSYPSIRSPWTQAEQEILIHSGIELNDAIRSRDIESDSWKQAILNTTNELILVMPSQNRGGSLPEHPLWDEIKLLMNLENNNLLSSISFDINSLNKEQLPMLNREIKQQKVIPDVPPEPRENWSAPKKVIHRREYESPSGMSQLIKCPLSWVLRYQLKLRAGAATSLEPDNRLAGTFAHSIIEDLIEITPDWTAQDASKKAMEIFDSRMRERAAAYFLPGMETEREKLKSRLGRAVSDLFNRIKDTKLEIKSSENSVKRTDKKGQEFIGTIDLLLKDSKNNPVVWDLKWSGSSKYRRQEMEQGLALQLAAYCWLLDDDDRPPYAAYYMLAQEELLANPAAWLSTDDQIETDLQVVWRNAHNRYNQLISELEKGKVHASTEDPDSEEDSSFTLKTNCNYCEYAMICGVGYE